MEISFRCRIRNISKKFPGVQALDDVTIDIRAGEIHAVVGENGAGKSTLMNILSGVFPADKGIIEYNGRERVFADPGEARSSGIAMIHQELSLFKEMSIYENIYIGRMPRKRSGFIDRRAMQLSSAESLKRLGVDDLDVKDLVSSLSISQMQLVEIAKALSLKADLLIMDEPTSSLTPAEIERILAVMKRLKEQGVSILFITHKLEEVMAAADRVTVLRDGRKIETMNIEDAGVSRMVSLMVGRDFDKIFQRRFINDYSRRTVMLEVKNLTIPSLMENISFQLYEGEVLGLTGLVGAGRSELLQGIFGVYPRRTGDIRLRGESVRIRHPRDAVNLGIGLVPEGRKEQGMFLKLDIKQNMTVVYRRRCINRFGMVDDGKLREKASEFVRSLSIKTTGPDQISNLLSGGNQQKTIIARWLMNNPRIVFMDEPTHGIDVGAKSEIYSIIDQLASRGVSVILLSSELPEVLALSDRIMVMHKGKIIRTLHNDEADEFSIMHHAFNQPAETVNKVTKFKKSERLETIKTTKTIKKVKSVKVQDGWNGM